MSESIQLLDHFENKELKYVWSVDIDATGKFLLIPFCDTSTRVKIEIFDLTQYWSSSSSTIVSSAAAASATNKTEKKKEQKKNSTAPLVSFDVKDIQVSLMYCFSGKFHPDPKKKLIAGAAGKSIRIFSWKQENADDNNNDNNNNNNNDDDDDDNNDDDDSPNNENFKEILQIDGKHNNHVHQVQFSNNGLFFLTCASSDFHLWNTDDDWSLVRKISSGSFYCWIGDDRRIPVDSAVEATLLLSSTAAAAASSSCSSESSPCHGYHFVCSDNKTFYRIVKKGTTITTKNEKSEFTVEELPWFSDPNFSDLMQQQQGSAKTKKHQHGTGYVDAISYSSPRNLLTFRESSDSAVNIIDMNSTSSRKEEEGEHFSHTGLRYSNSTFSSPESGGDILILFERMTSSIFFLRQSDTRDATSWKTIVISNNNSGTFSVKKCCHFTHNVQMYSVATSQQGILACAGDFGVTIHYAKCLCSFWERRKYLMLISEFSNLTHLKQALEMYVVKRNVAKFL